MNLERVEALSLRVLVGWIEYIKMNTEYLLGWATANWNTLINYRPNISILANGWLVFLFMEMNDAHNILEQLWVIGSSSFDLCR